MTTLTFRLKVASPALKLKVSPRLAASVVGANGITTSFTSGAWIVSVGPALANLTISNTTIDNTNAIMVRDNAFTMQDDVDATKQLQFQLSGITTGNTRTLTVPDGSTTLVGTALAQTLQNKTLDNTNTVTLKDTNFTLQDDADTTKQVVLQLSGISTGTTRTHNLPNFNGTLVGDTATQTLTNKTISGSSNTLTVLAGTQLSGQVPIANGGTAQATAAAARGSSGLNIDSFTGHGDSIYTILATDRTVGTNAAFTASRTWTLPAANAVNPGQEIIIADFQGTVTGTNTLIISRAGTDTINGGTTVTIASANGAYLLKSDGVSKWTAQALGATTSGTSVVTVKKQVFTASGTYTPSTGMLFAMIECIGAGAGGGGISNSGAGAAKSAGGGGGGAYSRLLASAATIGASQTVTIGAGGTAGANTDGNGGAGGDTSVGTLCVAKGGGFGAGGQFGAGGAGGAAASGTGDLKVQGNAGGTGNLSSITTIGLSTGMGGAGPFGGAPGLVIAASVSIIGAAGNVYGAGGNGGVSWNGGGAVTGGAGAAGVVFITEYCSQ